jgi:hypothetical protein
MNDMKNPLYMLAAGGLITVLRHGLREEAAEPSQNPPEPEIPSTLPRYL